MKMLEKRDNKLIWKGERHLLEVQPWGKDVIRVRATANRDFADVPGALVAQRGTAGSVEIGGDGAVVRSGTLEARVTSYGRVRFYRAGANEPLVEEVNWRADAPVLYAASREFKPLASDLSRAELRLAAYPGERFYGLGQHRHGLLDQKGAIIDLEQRNAEVTIPFTLSSRGYGLLWNNPATGRVELGTNLTRWVADATRQIDYVVMAGSGPAEIMERYADTTGHAPMLPDYAAGFWQCKLRYRTQEELLEVAREYKKRGLPLSVIVVDYFHWTRQGDWAWDPKCWPDPAAMIRELESMGVKLMVSVWPSVNVKGDNGKEMKSKGYLIGTNHGVDALFPFVDTYEERPATVHYYDTTNPEARDYVWSKVKASYWDKGVRIFWLDACEPEIYPWDFANLRFYAGTGAEVACIYPLMHEQGFYEHMKAAGQKEIVNLCRSGWAGSQRYGAALWSGDIGSTWEVFRGQVKAGLNTMLSGIPWWTTDIGGFYGGKVDDPDFRELLVRWFQWGLFCPLFRLHGVREPRTTGGAGSTGAPNEVWSYGEDVYKILKGLLETRERLRPYIMEQMKAASDKGTPPMRPLFHDYPGEPEAWGIEDEFLFGPDILVAPVVEKGARTRKVWLPVGASWVDAWSGKAVASGKRMDIDAPLDRIPVFLRAGAKVKLA
jgi:alpha-D-xyloside xylohydrolase